MNDTEMRAKLAESLSPKRFAHSVGVSNTAQELAMRFGYNTKKAALAGLLHDAAREIPVNELLPRAQAFGIVVNDIEQVSPILLHAPLSAKLAQSEFGIEDAEILQAIILHTTGGAKMTTLDKIIYLADMIEPNRNFKGVDKLRKMARTDMDKALLEALEKSIIYILKDGGLIHPATIAARNEIILNKIAQ